MANLAKNEEMVRETDRKRTGRSGPMVFLFKLTIVGTLLFPIKFVPTRSVHSAALESRFSKMNTKKVFIFALPHVATGAKEQ